MTKISELRVGDTGTVKFEVVSKYYTPHPVMELAEGWSFTVNGSDLGDVEVATLIRAPKPIQVGDTVIRKGYGYTAGKVISIFGQHAWVDVFDSYPATYNLGNLEHIND